MISQSKRRNKRAKLVVDDVIELEVLEPVDNLGHYLHLPGNRQLGWIRAMLEVDEIMRQ